MPTFWPPSTWRLPTFGRAAIEDDRHSAIVGEGRLEVFVIVQGVTRHDEEQTWTCGGCSLPIAFTTVPSRVSGHRCSIEQSECISEERSVGVIWIELCGVMNR